jgi:hypothetical protein
MDTFGIFGRRGQLPLQKKQELGWRLALDAGRHVSGLPPLPHVYQLRAMTHDFRGIGVVA